MNINTILAHKKIIFIGIAVLAVVIIAAAILSNLPKNTTQNPAENQPVAGELNPLNARYFVEYQLVSLENGKSENTSADGSKITTQIAGTPVTGDLNSDGQPDWAVILTQKTANDVGVYYYAAIALVDEEKRLIVGSNAVAIGDRIDLRNIAIVNQAVKVDYLDWKIDGDAVESLPTVPTSKSFILDGVMFKELTDKRANAQVEAACTDNGGTWIVTSNQCKGLSRDWCDKSGGKFEDNLCKF
ncbi:MAG: hypothetical protein L7H18_01515 [Candidatus Nealsonbacteria bacterium DGGOD1a]|nr:MAG: hypothetical protein L7H18_01515 [Candidatus Nealsonbacteria bacterium DGGOD1a]